MKFFAKGTGHPCAFRLKRAYPMTMSSRCPGSSGVEQWIENPRVGGSIPPLGTIFAHLYLRFIFIIKDLVFDLR